MSYVYLIQSMEYYKIGIANDVESRLSQLQTGNPNELSISSCYDFPNAQAVETVLHQKFSAFRKLGEWFHFYSNEVKQFHEICQMLGGVSYSPNSIVSTPNQIEEAESILDGTQWCELVKVKSWHYVRLMRWDATNKKKVYVRHIGTLAKCKEDPEYSDEARRLEKNIREEK